MNNFAEYITPERAKENGDSRSLAALKALAARKDRICENCDEMAWRLGGVGLCFSCTTGEADASEDYELAHIPTPHGKFPSNG
jgi:hypothetical protein